MAVNKSDVSVQKQAESYRKETILIVDDEPVLRKLNAHILASQGYLIIEAATAQIALELLREHAVDLVLSDVFMPHMNGYELAEKIHQQHPNVVIQLVSGCGGDDEGSVLAKQLNAQLLQKPFSSTLLFEHIRARLDNK